MKHFHSSQAFKKYKPEEGFKKKLSRIFSRKQKIIPISEAPSHYKSNPFKAKNQPRQNKTGYKIAILIVVLVGWIFALGYTPYFQVDKILYFNLGNTSRSEIDSFVRANYLNRKSWLPTNNYFFINTVQLSSDIRERFSLDSVEVKKIFPNELNIEVKEKISAIVYDNGQKYFLLDSEGNVIKQLAEVSKEELKPISRSIHLNQLSNSDLKLLTSGPSFVSSTTVTNTTSSQPTQTTSTSATSSTEPVYEHTPNNEKIKRYFAEYPIVYDKRNLSVEEKQKNIIPADFISSIITWNKELSQQGRLMPKFFVFDDLNSGVVIDTSEPWFIIFQPKNNTETQIKVLNELLTTIKPKEYIDLRFGEKVYWK